MIVRRLMGVNERPRLFPAGVKISVRESHTVNRIQHRSAGVEVGPVAPVMTHEIEGLKGLEEIHEQREVMVQTLRDRSALLLIHFLAHQHMSCVYLQAVPPLRPKPVFRGILLGRQRDADGKEDFLKSSAECNTFHRSGVSVKKQVRRAYWVSRIRVLFHPTLHKILRQAISTQPDDFRGSFVQPPFSFDIHLHALPLKRPSVVK